MPSSSEPNGPERGGPDSWGSSSIVPTSLLKRGARLLLRRPGRGLLAYAVLAVGLSAAAFLPRGAAALLGISEAPILPRISSESDMGTSWAMNMLPTYSFSPPDYPEQPTGQAVGDAIESIEQMSTATVVEMVPEVFLAVAAGVAAFLLAGPAVAGAYALALPCAREEGPESDGADPANLHANGLSVGSLFSSALAFAAASVAMLAGLLLLVVPGAVVAAGLAPLMPLIVETGREPREAIRRAWRLTEGHRWQIFGLYLLVWVVATIAAGLAAAIAFGVESLGGPAAPAGIGAGLLLGTGVGAWNLLARCCLYRRLKRLDGS